MYRKKIVKNPRLFRLQINIYKDPCISHVDASHAERPRTESSLLFCTFFYFVKIVEKSLFYEPEIGFIGKITS
jgi:hypothetical protein